MLPAIAKNIPSALFFLIQASKLFSAGETMLFRPDTSVAQRGAMQHHYDRTVTAPRTKPEKMSEKMASMGPGTGRVRPRILKIA
jgi:hypothetical protein